ncbi:MAG: AAA family ATPase [Legionella sp.]|uniref:AAA family ATPase n=1 Tax=Legionella sp. TaxID=459 RepID=UPI00284F12CB|nr:AAA family ATPase [Legionella sp.]
MIGEEFLWTERYRPHKVDDCVLPESLKTTFKQYVLQGNVPNHTFSGGPGMGKTTVAKAILDEIGADYYVVNGSLNGNIDTLRNEISTFASSVSLMGGRKYVIIDEADGLNPLSTQPSLRSFIEEYSSNCGFILTCNLKNKIVSALQSRCPVIDFKIDKADKQKIAGAFFKRVCAILTQENIEFDKAVVAELIQKYFPDFRETLGQLQRYSACGRIDSGILCNLHDVSIKELIGFMKEKNFTSVRKWVAENSDADPATVFRNFYNTASEYFTKGTIPALVMIIGKYQYQASFVACPEINNAAFCVEVMIECEFV